MSDTPTDEVTYLPTLKKLIAERSVAAKLENRFPDDRGVSMASYRAHEALVNGVLAMLPEIVADLERVTELEAKVAALETALAKAIQQNECDMLLTGDELRQMRAALLPAQQPRGQM